MRFEEPYRDMFRAYGALASFCAFDCTERPSLQLLNDRGGKVIMNTPFFAVREDEPATLGSCGRSLMSSSGGSSARFFPLPLKLKDENVRFNVPSVCRYQPC